MRDEETRQRSRLTGLPVLLALLALGCGAQPDRRPNIILITIDTLRADHLASYGYFRTTTPALDALASEALVFEACRAPVAQTLPTHTSILTGLYPREHGIESNFDQVRGSYVPASGIKSFATYMQEIGYLTAGFVSAEPVKRESGLAQGFDVWWQPESKKTSANLSVHQAANYLRQRHEQPVFMWLHVFDPHMPFRPPPPYDTLFESGPELDDYLARNGIPALTPASERREQRDSRDEHNLYDGEIRFVDDQIKRIFVVLQELDVWQNSVVVVTSDHGEGLGQHMSNGHEKLWQEQLHVPLIMRVPGLAARRVTASMTSSDILPTLIALLPEIDGSGFIEQCSGVDALAPGREPRPGYAQLPSSGGRTGHALTWGGWRLVMGESLRSRLYRLADDPLEEHNLAKEHPEKVAELQALLEREIAAQQATRERFGAGTMTPVSSDRRERLEALGYGGGD